MEQYGETALTTACICFEQVYDFDFIPATNADTCVNQRLQLSREVLKNTRAPVIGAVLHLQQGTLCQLYFSVLLF